MNGITPALRETDTFDTFYGIGVMVLRVTPARSIRKRMLDSKSGKLLAAGRLLR